MSIVYRQELGRELTWSEADNNFAELKAGVDSKKSNFDVLPVTQGGTGQATVDAVKVAFDIATKTELASSAAGKGAELVEYHGATVEAALDERLPEIGNYAGLDAYAGDATAVLVYGVQNIFDGGAGVFRRTTDTPSAANGIYRQDALGRWWKRDYSGDVLVDWFGRDGDAAQSAIDSLGDAGGVVSFNTTVEYAVKRHVGTNDRWGLLVKYSNITLKGNRCVIRRYDSDISTYALAYPIILVGTPDSNSAAATKNVTVVGFIFVGEDTRHSSSGSALHDGRYAIEAKNTVNLSVENNVFTNVDSSVIWYQAPQTYDYANSTYYNTTNNFNSKFVGNRCVANSHVVVGRALIHAVCCIGVDDCIVDSNRFEWCDDAVISDSTYDLETVQGSTYTSVHLGSIVRSGRGVIVSNNTITNSSEHPIYLTGFDEVVTNNKITSDVLANTATNDAIKIRSYGCSVTGNNISNYGSGISVSAGALNVAVTGNSVYVPSTGSLGLGAIGVSSAGLSSYVSGRISAGCWSVYRQMSGINISGNSITFQTAAVSPANTRRDIGFTILSDNADANYPNGQISGVAITGNSVSNYQVGVHVSGLMYRNAVVSGNTFTAKPFTETAFSTSTTMNTRCVVQTLRNSTTELSNLQFTGNTIYGCKYLWASFDGGGAAASIYPPRLFNDNIIKFAQYGGTPDFLAPGASPIASFKGNTGAVFLDRTWGGYAVNNSLYADDSSTDNQARKQCFLLAGGALRFYTDDAGTFLTL